MKIFDWAQKENRLYGHSLILQEALGLKSSGIAGRLQHGWNPTDGFGFWEGRRFKGRLYVWSHRVWNDLPKQQQRRCVVVGSPWAHLHKMHLNDLTNIKPEANSVICIPAHSSARAEVVGDHRTYAQEVLSREHQDKRVTVSLFWRDYENPVIRAAYQDAGLEVITLGNPADYSGSGFLLQQMKLLRTFERCVSSRVISAVLYASALGLEVELYGSPLKIAGEMDPHAESLRRWPELFGPYSSSKMRDFAASELGLEVLDDIGSKTNLLVVSPSANFAFLLQRMSDSVRRRLRSSRK